MARNRTSPVGGDQEAKEEIEVDAAEKTRALERDGRGRGDHDRLRHLPDAGRDRRAGAESSRYSRALGRRRPPFFMRRALLRRTGRDDPGSRWFLSLAPRRVGPPRRVSLRLV